MKSVLIFLLMTISINANSQIIKVKTYFDFEIIKVFTIDCSSKKLIKIEFIDISSNKVLKSLSLNEDLKGTKLCDKPL